MCFSATASFAASAALVPAGAYCVHAAIRKNRAYLPLAAVPLVFAVQQFTEGLVWVGLHHDDVALVQSASVAYLYFAIAFWPFWIPLSFLCIENRPGMRWLLGAMTVLGLAWTWLYLPIAAHPNRWLTTVVVGHSIRYAITTIPGYAILPRGVWLLGYALLVAIPIVWQLRQPVNNRTRAFNFVAALTLATSFAVSYLVFWQVFTSVWCFFAALLALLLCYSFYQLPATDERPWRLWLRPIAADRRI